MVTKMVLVVIDLLIDSSSLVVRILHVTLVLGLSVEIDLSVVFDSVSCNRFFFFFFHFDL